jgi:hypothetical protein
MVIAAVLAVLFIWWLPYFCHGWLPFSEWGYGLIWGDWLSDRLWLVGQKIIPAWNPNNVLGVNYIGRDPFNNPLSLGNIFKLFFNDPKSEWIIGLFFFLTIMALGTYKFLKNNGLSSYLALLGAALIVIYPKWMDDIYHGPGKFVTAYSVLPWMMIITQSMFSVSPRLIHYLLLGVLGAAAFLGSGAWVAILIAYIIIPYFLYNNVKYLLKIQEKRGRAVFTGLLGISLSLIIALGLSSYLLLPLWDNIHLSARSLYAPPTGYGLIDALGTFFPWQNRLYTLGYYDFPLYLPFGVGMISNFRSYFGILFLPLLAYVLGTQDLRKKYVFFWVWPLVMALLFSKLGNQFFPLARLLEERLGAQSSENFLFFGFIFCFNILMMASLNDIWEKARANPAEVTAISAKSMWANRVAFFLMMLYLAAIMVWLILWVVTHYFGSIFNVLLSLSILKDIKNFIGLHLLFYTFFYDYFFYLLLLAFIIRLGILFWFYRGRFARRSYGLTLLGLLMCLDFLLFPKMIYPFTASLDRRYSSELEQNAFVQRTVKVTERIGSNDITEKYRRKLALFKKAAEDYRDRGIWDPKGVYQTIAAVNPDAGFFEPLFDPGVSYYAATQNRQTYNYHESLLPDFFYDFDKALNGGNPRYFRQSWVSLWDPSSRLLDIAGISYLFWYEPINDPRLLLVGRYPVGDGYIYQNSKAVSKAYVALNLEFFSSRQDLLKRLQDPSFEPRLTVATEDQKLYAAFRRLKSASRTGGKAGETTLVAYGPNEIIVDVKVKEPSILVVTDLFFPYWRATIDQAGATIHRVNCVFRGILVDRGEHRVVLKYYNEPFHRGIKISAITALAVILLLAAAVVFEYRRKCLPNSC